MRSNRQTMLERLRCLIRRLRQAASGWRRDQGGPPHPGEELTRRQRQAAILAEMGFTTKEIAVELDLAESTVKFHLNHVYRKLGIGSRAELGQHLFDRRWPGPPGKTGAGAAGRAQKAPARGRPHAGPNRTGDRSEPRARPQARPRLRR
jgi:DNA-binding CsgD family transcriptional regulator